MDMPQLDLKKQIKEEKRFASGFYREDNFSNAYFCYFRLTKFLAANYLRETTENKDVKPNEALAFLASKGMFGLEPKEVEELTADFDKVIHRKVVNKKECNEVRKMAEKLYKETKKFI